MKVSVQAVLTLVLLGHLQPLKATSTPKPPGEKSSVLDAIEGFFRWPQAAVVGKAGTAKLPTAPIPKGGNESETGRVSQEERGTKTHKGQASKVVNKAGGPTPRRGTSGKKAKGPSNPRDDKKATKQEIPDHGKDASKEPLPVERASEEDKAKRKDKDKGGQAAPPVPSKQSTTVAGKAGDVGPLKKDGKQDQVPGPPLSSPRPEPFLEQLLAFVGVPDFDVFALVSKMAKEKSDARFNQQATRIFPDWNKDGLGKDPFWQGVVRSVLRLEGAYDQKKQASFDSLINELTGGKFEYRAVMHLAKAGLSPKYWTMFRSKAWRWGEGFLDLCSNLLNPAVLRYATFLMAFFEAGRGDLFRDWLKDNPSLPATGISTAALSASSDKRVQQPLDLDALVEASIKEYPDWHADPNKWFLQVMVYLREKRKGGNRQVENTVKIIEKLVRENRTVAIALLSRLGIPTEHWKSIWGGATSEHRSLIVKAFVKEGSLDLLNKVVFGVPSAVRWKLSHREASKLFITAIEYDQWHLMKHLARFITDVDFKLPLYVLETRLDCAAIYDNWLAFEEVYKLAHSSEYRWFNLDAVVATLGKLIVTTLRWGSFATLKFLFEHFDAPAGTQAYYRSKYENRCPLYAAVFRGDCGALEYFLGRLQAEPEKYGEFFGIDRESAPKITSGGHPDPGHPLVWAIYFCQADMVELLLAVPKDAGRGLYVHPEVEDYKRLIRYANTFRKLYGERVNGIVSLLKASFQEAHDQTDNGVGGQV